MQETHPRGTQYARAARCHGAALRRGAGDPGGGQRLLPLSLPLRQAELAAVGIDDRKKSRNRTSWRTKSGVQQKSDLFSSNGVTATPSTLGMDWNI